MPRTTLLRKQVTPTGTIQPHAGGTAPDGFLVCDGSIVNIADYPRLYAVIGTTWGHGLNDGLTFHLPDLRGRFLRGQDDSAGNDPDAAGRTAANAGGATGDNVGTIQGHQFGSHNHGGGSHGHSTRTFSDNGFPDGSGDRTNAYYLMHYNRGTDFSLSVNGSGTIISTQGGSENRPVNANVKYVIKAL